MADNIQDISNNKKAIKDKIYYDSFGNSFIGLRNGRLEKVFKVSSIDTRETNGKITEKFFSYDTDDNITTIREYSNSNLVLTKEFQYDTDGNINQIINSGSERETKKFYYDSDGNITTINII